MTARCAIIGHSFVIRRNGKLSAKTFKKGANTVNAASYAYDAENRLTAITNSCGISIGYAFNSAQQITGMVENAGTTNAASSFSYDNRDQLISEIHSSTLPSFQSSNSFTYDANQNRTGSVNSSVNGAVTSLYDIIVANKLNAITNTSGSGLPDDGDGLALNAELLYGCNPTKADTDGDGWNDAVEVASNTLPYDTDTDNDTVPDPIDPSPHFPGNAIWFGASSNAPPNHWWVTSPGKPYFDIKTYTYHRYFYDTAGNLSMRIHNAATNRFYYNAQNKLVRIEGPGWTNEFLYDSLNRRIAIKTATIWRYDLHEGSICFASVTNGILERFFVRGAGIAEGTADVTAEADGGGTLHFYVANHRGDTVAAIHGTTLALDRYAYDAFGNPVSIGTTSFAPRYTFSTKEYLADARGYLYQYRFYDCVAGRWTQRDPIGYEDSPNLYQFCGNNPVNDIDGFGLATAGPVGPPIPPPYWMTARPQQNPNAKRSQDIMPEPDYNDPGHDPFLHSQHSENKSNSESKPVTLETKERKDKETKAYWDAQGLMITTITTKIKTETTQNKVSLNKSSTTNIFFWRTNELKYTKHNWVDKTPKMTNAQGE